MMTCCSSSVARCCLAFLCLAVIAFSLPVHARALDPVVVVGDRHAYTRGHSGAAVTIIDRQDIVRHGWLTMREALRSVPGLHVSSSGGQGAQTSVFMRGTESNHVVVLMDGVELTDPAADQLAAFADLQLHHVEKIEIIRGPYSSRYGSGALGGVINIISRQSSQHNEAELQLEYGNHHYRRGNVTFSTRSAQPHGWQQLSSLSYWKTAGESFTPARLRGGSAGEDDAYRNVNFYTAASGKPSADEQLRFNFNYNRAASEYDALSPPYEQRLSDDKRSHHARLQLSGNYLHGLWQPQWQLSHYRRLFRTPTYRARGERFKLQWHNDLFSARSLSGGFGLDTELESWHGPERENRRSNSVYVQLSLSPLPHFMLDGGWRLDDAEHFSHATSWHFSGRYAWPQSGTQIRFAYGTAFRAPSLSENFGLWGHTDLRPEKSRSWDFGIEQWLAGNKMHLGLGYFNNRLRELISADLHNQVLLNTDRATIEGLELFAALKPTIHFDVRLDYSWLSAHDQDHQRLLRRPVRKGTLDIAWLLPQLMVSLQANYHGGRDDISRDRFIRTRLGGYTTVDLSARRAINQSSDVFLQFSNVLDKSYEPVDGYQGEGWMARLGFAYRAKL